MSLDECVAVLTPYVLAVRADFDKPTFRAYHRVLKDCPAALAESALEEWAKTGPRFMPSAPEILTLAEKRRRQVLALRPWTPCADCEDWPGYRKVLVAGGGAETREKCPCRARHREMLDRQGLVQPLAELPHEVNAGDEKTYPSVDQLPAGLRAQITAVAARKLLS